MNLRRLLIPGLVIGLLPGIAKAQAPTLTHTTPYALKPGQAVDITLHGTNLAGATQIWTSFPAESILAPGIDKNGTDAAKVTYRVTLPANAPAGIGGIRATTGKGVSNLRLLMVDDLPTIVDNGQNKSVDKAQELNLPVAVDGACEAESYDYYRLNLTKGARVSIEVVSRRLGSALDPVMRILDAAGRELVYSDDEPGIGADCRAAFVAPADAAYFLELRDIQYGGSANHRYRLRVGDFPLLSVPYPLAAKKGSASKLEFAGPAVEGLPILEVTLPEAAKSDSIAVSAKLSQGQGSGMARVIASDLIEQVEAEPNDAIKESTKIAIPGGINGRLAAPKDRDYYQFEAKKGQRFVFRGLTRSLGSPTDLFLRIYKPDGASLAEAEDSGTEEGVINFTFPEDGVYHLMAEDLLRRGGPAHAYRVAVEPYRPGFSLALDADKFDPPQAGVFVTKITAARRDYTGPITLSVEGIEGCELAANTIPEGKPDTTLRVTLPASIPAGTFVPFSIVGKAKIGEAEFSAKADAVAVLQKQFTTTRMPDELNSVLALGVGPTFPEFFKLSVEPGNVLFPQLVGTNTFKVKTEKLNKFDDAIALAIEGLPDGVTAEVKPIEKGKPESVVTLKGPEGLPEGEHKFKITGSATFQNQPGKVVLNEVTLRVIKPLVVTANLAGPITQGGKQKIKIGITRFGDHKAPVNLVFKELPNGVTAPEAATIAEGQNEVEFELTAAADAAIGKAEKVVVAATTKVKDQDVSVESAAFAVEVKAP